MIKINGLTEDQVTSICDKIAKNHQQKCFDVHNEEDIYQQAWVIILEKLHDFTEWKTKDDNVGQALENFLNSVVSNRLSNFYRDKYVVRLRKRKADTDTDHSKRISLANPIDIALTEEIQHEEKEELLEWEYLHKIVHLLSIESFDILESLLSAEKLSCYYKKKLITEIQKIYDETSEKDID